MRKCINPSCRRELADETEVCGNCGIRQPAGDTRAAGGAGMEPPIRQVSVGENITQLQRITSGIKGLFVLVINVDRGASSANRERHATGAPSPSGAYPWLRWLAWLTIPAGVLSIIAFSLAQLHAELYRWSNAIGLVALLCVGLAFVGELNRPFTRMNGSVSVNALLLMVLWILGFLGVWTLPGLRELTLVASVTLVTVASVSHLHKVI